MKEVLKPGTAGDPESASSPVPADQDPLTGALNRVRILREIEGAIRETDPGDPRYVVLCINIDGFREVNEHFCHETGDRLLVEMARRLESVSKSACRLGRIGADEFVLLLRHPGKEGDLRELLERTRRTISHPYMLGGLEIRISASIGCVEITDPKIPLSELLRRGEMAMSLVKKGYSKDVCVVGKNIVEELENNRILDEKIRKAIEQKRFLLSFQPVVEIESGTCAEAEALLRLSDDDGTLMTASCFMEAIARTEQGMCIDEWVLAESIHTKRMHASALPGLADITFSINVSPAILISKEYSRHCLQLMEAANVSPGAFHFEIMQNQLFGENPVLLENLRELRREGVRLAVDDFGQGAGDLRHLTRIPIDVIKIDAAYMKGIRVGDPRGMDLLGALSDIARRLGYRPVAKGVELKSDTDCLRSLGIRHAQGYFFGRPMPIKELLEYPGIRKG